MTLLRVKALIAAAIVLLPIVAFARAPDIGHGRVVHIVDGDTLHVMFEGGRVRVRLVEIDAPEQGQPFGLRSRQSLIQICGGELASIDSKGKDRNGRVLGRVTCNGTDANAEQVRRGMAWVFDRYAKPDSPLYAVQDEARSARRGL